MTNTTNENSDPKSGSIAVYQRNVPGKRPAKVEILRAVYETYRDPDDRAFGRTNNTVLLRVQSGMDCLSTQDVATLGQLGLNEREIAHVNRRLSELAGPAQARAREMDILEAKEMLKAVVSRTESTPSLAMDLRAMLTGALHEVEERIKKDGGPADSGGGTPTELLKRALGQLNQACVEAQSLYKRLPKGELADDLLLEYQRSWFLHPDMISTFRNRKCFSRPPGWSGLRTQILAGNVYNYGDPVQLGKQWLNSALDQSP